MRDFEEEAAHASKAAAEYVDDAYEGRGAANPLDDATSLAVELTGVRMELANIARMLGALTNEVRAFASTATNRRS